MTMMNRLVAAAAILCTVIAMVVLTACSQSAKYAAGSAYLADASRQNGQLLFEKDLGVPGAQIIAPSTGYVIAPETLDSAAGTYRGARTVQAPASAAPPPSVGASYVTGTPDLSARGPSDSSAAAAQKSSAADREAAEYPPDWPEVSMRRGGDARDAPQAQQGQPDFITRINPGEELWVIVEADDAVRTLPTDDAPGCGSLVTILPGQNGFVPVPLEHTEVQGNVSGYIASVDVKQSFHNPYDTKIEAVYVFPLPENAAVRDFLMTIGSRTIRGIIREREEAQRIYADARAAGHVASLMTQERPNIFTQRVANIEPGKNIDIDITYYNTLAYSDGWFEFVFPMVVGPRYNPPSTAINGAGIGAVPRNEPGASGQAVEVAYLRPNERSGHDISVDLRIDAGMAIEEVASKSHRIEVSREGPNVRRVRLARSDTVPNKDLVVRYRVASDAVKSSLFTRVGDDGAGYFTMLLVPPQTPARLERALVEFVFVLDSSGSMSGTPIRLAKDAVREALDQMRDDDTFQIIDFADSVSQLGNRPLVASAENLRRGRKYLDSLGAGGGTQMINGIRAALDFPLDAGRTRFVVFLTDGYIGNESQILAEIDGKIGNSRIFSFGIGSSVNRFLMDEMAKTGRGAVAYIGERDRARQVMAMFFDRVSHPAMTDVRLDLGALAGAEMYPQRVPDLFVGRPVVITGRYDASRAGTTLRDVRITGDVGSRRITMQVPQESRGADQTGALEAIWARAKIACLSNAALRGDPHGELSGAIRQTALAHGLLSQFTAFIAVDSLTITEGSRGVTVPVPVPVPQGVEYSTTVGDARDR